LHDAPDRRLDRSASQRLFSQFSGILGGPREADRCIALGHKAIPWTLTRTETPLLFF
jgi:hypothetical protein